VLKPNLIINLDKPLINIIILNKLITTIKIKEE